MNPDQPATKKNSLNSRELNIMSLFMGVVVLCCLWMNIAVGQSANASANRVDNVRLWHSPDKTRVVFDVSENIKHKVFTLENPKRFVVDIENIGLGKKLPVLDENNPHIKNIRSGVPRAGVLRFVFELKKSLEAHSFVLTPNELYGHRLVLDLLDPEMQNKEELAIATANVLSAATEMRQQQNTVNQAPASLISRGPKQLVVAVNAGHGGEDPGALGHRGSREKQITLSIAKRLQKVINADSRMRAILIRTGDYYIDLNRRRNMAREQGADIYISIHADAFTKRSANGLSVFALSQRGATSAMARALAAKENASDAIGGVSLTNKDVVLAQVLVDLSMTNTISESVNLGGRVLKELSKLGRLHSKRVEQAAFVELKSPDMPSILIETGFITNLNEEKKLRSSRYQNKLAKAIHKAIGEYYEQTPYYSQSSYASPVITSNSSSRRSNTGTKSRPASHKVKRGDSLSSIALKYGTSIRTLKRINNLKRDTVILGQRLKLPGAVKVASSNQSTSNAPSYHVVKRGDSLSKISARYNVTINALKRLNGLRKNTLYKGQKIKLPQGLKSRPSRPSKPRQHKVKRGDTLSEIAERYGVTIKQIMQANNLRSRTVMIGQKLKIP